ncbi:hypothetical protein [Carnobacterium maltaromaticum]|uniref:hypothetical protein n=1 Tax=Carnobacterium maltaromaticum TaxID=2751 RepID=UPI00295F5A85|nr:hypothetical protein [Carnobacterium maltaromaticum]
MMPTDHKIKNRSLVVIAISLFFYFLFANALNNSFPKFEKLPLFEAVYIAMVIAIFISQTIVKKRLFVGEYIMIGMFILLFLFGLISNVFLNYQGLKIVALDGVILSKFFVAYFFGRLLYSPEIVNKVMGTLQKCVQLISSVLFVSLVLNLIFSFWPPDGSRFGLPVQYLFFSHATYLTSTAVFCLIFLSLKRGRYDFLFIGMNLIIVITAGRNKGMLFLGIYLFFILIQFTKKKIPIWSILGMSIFLYSLFKNVISERLLSSETAARSVLYQNGLFLANKYFPFGTGFGTYASSASIQNYSTVYEELGFGQMYGFSQQTTFYLTDSFIAMIMGQFGYIGLFLMSSIFVCIFLLVKKNNQYENFILLLYIYILLSTVTENFISSTYGVLAFFLIGMLVNRKNRDNSEDSVYHYLKN